jgi:hypothetical protein
MRVYEDCYRDIESDEASVEVSFQSYSLKNTNEAPIKNALSASI